MEFAVYAGQHEVTLRFMQALNPGKSQRGIWRVVCDVNNKHGIKTPFWSEESWRTGAEAEEWTRLLNDQNRKARYSFRTAEYHW